MKQIVFILHGKVKHQHNIIAHINACFNDKDSLRFCVTEKADHATELAYNAVRDNATHIICMGGDGSLNEVVNGVMLARQEGLGLKNENSVRVGLLPYGTGNDFARSVGATKNVEVLKSWIDADVYRQIDLGLARFEDANGVAKERYFINITDVGIGGVIAHNLSTSSKIFGPTITYQKEILTALLTYKNQPISLQADSVNYNGSAMSLIVANGAFFGGGMGIAPHALLDDGLFSVVLIGEISIFEYLKNLGNIKKSKKIEHPEVKYITAARVEVDSPSKPLPIDMDGEFIGYSPLTLNIIPDALRFIAPK